MYINTLQIQGKKKKSLESSQCLKLAGWKYISPPVTVVRWFSLGSSCELTAFKGNFPYTSNTVTTGHFYFFLSQAIYFLNHT